MLRGIFIPVLVLLFIAPWFSPLSAALDGCRACKDDVCMLDGSGCRHGHHGGSHGQKDSGHDHHGGHVAAASAKDHGGVEEKADGCSKGTTIGCRPERSSDTLLPVQGDDPYLMVSVPPFSRDIAGKPLPQDSNTSFNAYINPPERPPTEA